MTNVFANRGLGFAALGVAAMMLVALPVIADDLDPTSELSVTWIPEVRPAADSEADDEAGMKAYTEEIEGNEDLDFQMVPIPGGTFLMGSPEDEADRRDDEGPQAEVAIKPFWMADVEVTWDLFEEYQFKMDQQRRKAVGRDLSAQETIAEAIARPTAPYADMTFGMGKDGYPAICMTQFAAKMFCKWLTAKTGRYYRLPTEAEWEYACRAGTTTAYSFGDDVDDLEDYAYVDQEDGYGEIRTKKPNPWGLYDMHGNVAEWVLDQLGEYGQNGDQPFNVPTELFPRVVRGGSWYDFPEDCRSAARMGSTEDWKMQDPQIPQSIWYHTDSIFVGFRVIRPLEVPSAEEATLYEPDSAILDEYREAQGGKE